MGRQRGGSDGPGDGAKLRIDREPSDERLGGWDDEREAAPRPVLREVPSCRALGEPLHAGYLLKLRPRCCGCCAAWKRRYFVLVGAYLWRFESPESRKPKGVPVPVLGAEWAPAEPRPGHPHVLRLSTLRKEYTLAAPSREVRAEWITALDSQRVVALKQEMGHLPASQDTVRANAMGDYLTNRKGRQVEADRRSRAQLLDSDAFQAGVVPGA